MKPVIGKPHWAIRHRYVHMDRAGNRERSSRCVAALGRKAYGALCFQRFATRDAAEALVKTLPESIQADVEIGEVMDLFF